MTEPKNGRPIFFPENLVLFGNLALFLWIVLDSVAFLLYNFIAGIVFFILTLILIYGVLAHSGLPTSMLQLHKMHSWHGALGSLILWQTHL